MNDGFGVGVGTKTMSFSFEFEAQIGEIENLAVVGDPHRPIFVAHGHVAIGGEVENGEAAAAQPDVSAIGETPLPEPGVVGAAVRLHVRHPGELLRIAAVHESADAAHGVSSFRSAARRFSPWYGTSAPLERHNKSGPAHRREIPGEKYNGR